MTNIPEVAQLIASSTELLRSLFIVILAVVPLLGGYFLIRLFFQNVNRSTPESVRNLIQSQLETNHYNVLARDLTPLLAKEQLLEQKRREQEREEAFLEVEQTQEKAEIGNKLKETEKALAEVRATINKQADSYREDAKLFARSMVKDLTVEGIISSKSDSRPLVVQYATVTIIITSVLSLAMLELLAAEQVAPILAAVAGYVLGKTTSEPS